MIFSIRLVPWAMLAAGLIFAYVTRGILLPFLAGFTIAYLLDPVADRLERAGVGRGMAAGLLIALGFWFFVCTLIGLWPLLQSQIVGIVRIVPGVIEAARERANDLVTLLDDQYGGTIGAEAESLLASAIEKGLMALHGLGARLFAGGLAFFNLLSLLLITPMVAFYLLRDYDHIIAKLDGMLPPEHAPFLRRIFRDIDHVLACFVRGQLSVMGVMAVLYAAGWAAVGLDYSLMLGLLAGVLGIIPFIGTLFAAAIALAVGFGQWGADPMHLSLVAGVWLIVQILEGSILTPRLLGSSVGLHPVWVLFAVFAGGEVAGFVGVLIAVPAAAVISVLVRSSYARYRTSLPEPILPGSAPEAKAPAGPETPVS
ncbi:MAG: AI-2E family transporter [Rhodothalassiaceae bacterium]